MLHQAENAKSWLHFTNTQQLGCAVLHPSSPLLITLHILDFHYLQHQRSFICLRRSQWRARSCQISHCCPQIRSLAVKTRHVLHWTVAFKNLRRKDINCLSLQNISSHAEPYASHIHTYIVAVMLCVCVRYLFIILMCSLRVSSMHTRSSLKMIDVMSIQVGVASCRMTPPTYTELGLSLFLMM